MSDLHYWMHETGGQLRAAIGAYLERRPLSGADVDALRAYLRLWIMSPAWRGDGVLDQLRTRVDGLGDRAAIRQWLDDASRIGIDPL